MTLKINPQKYSWPQKTCKPLNNKFPGSNWSVVVMPIKQSEVYDKVLVTKFCVFLTRPGTVTNLGFCFCGFRKIIKEKNLGTFLGLPYAISERNMKTLFFFVFHVRRLALR